MKEFFKVKTIDEALACTKHFPCMPTEDVPLTESEGRVPASDIRSDIDLPDFARSTMADPVHLPQAQWCAGVAAPGGVSIRVRFS